MIRNIRPILYESVYSKASNRGFILKALADLNVSFDPILNETSPTIILPLKQTYTKKKTHTEIQQDLTNLINPILLNIFEMNRDSISANLNYFAYTLNLTIDQATDEFFNILANNMNRVFFVTIVQHDKNVSASVNL